VQLQAVTRVHVDSLRHEVASIKTTDRVQTEEPLAVDVAHEEANFVHVRCHQYSDRFAVGRVAPRMADANRVANRVDVNRVDERAQRVKDDPADYLLARGHAGRLGQ
jgi:hypothetical protein